MHRKESIDNTTAIGNFTLFSLHTDILDIILSFLDPKSLAKLALIKKIGAQHSAKRRLINYLVDSITTIEKYNSDHISSILNHYPFTIVLKDEKKSISPWQAVWLTGNEFLIRLMLEILPLDDKEKAKKQYRQLFPNGRNRSDSTAEMILIAANLAEITQALNNDYCTYGVATTEELKTASTNFENCLNFNSEIVNSSPKVLALVYRFYEDIYKHYHTISSNYRLSWFSTQIIAKTIRCSSPIDVHRYRSGLGIFFKNLMPSKISYATTQEFDPYNGEDLQTPSSDKLYIGDEYFMNVAPEIKRYVEIKERRLKSLEQRLFNNDLTMKPVVNV